MTTNPPPSMRATVESPGTASAEAVRDVAGWISHLGRALKTCRLYDPDNPTVVRFREDVASGLADLLQRHGAVRLEVTSRELLYEGASVYAARSRDDNLSATFHRDGIRALTFSPGIEAREVECLLDQILHVTGPLAGDDDLVTLFWEHDLPSLAIEAVPIEGDVDGGAGEEGQESGGVPWPREGTAPASGSAASSGTGAPESGTRSDDWQLLEHLGDSDEAFRELEVDAALELARLRQEYASELERPMVAAVVEVVADSLATPTRPADREEISRFLPRVLREAITLGEWAVARTALGLLRTCDPQWSAQKFFDGLFDTQAMLTHKAVIELDQQADPQIAEFIGLASDMGEGAVDWLMHVLAESQQKRARRPLARTIAMLAKDNPERLLPWLSDPRWFVVRNVVHILGWVGGDDVAGYLKSVGDHPEMRVRREAVATLSQASPAVARPILLAMLGSAEPRLFTLILQQLALHQDPEVSAQLMALLRDQQFPGRTDDEKRAVYMALASQGDGVVQALEEELHRGGRFGRAMDFHWQSLALCLARIGTPAARAALERGVKSNKPGIRKACEQARALRRNGDD